MRWIIFVLLFWAFPVWASQYALPHPSDSVVGKVQYLTATYEDTLAEIARHYDIGYENLRRANPDVDPWLPKSGTQILIPSEYILPEAPREGIVINLAAMRLFYYPKGAKEVITYPIGIGREGWGTPLGVTRVVAKVKDPSWTPPESIRKEHAQAGDPLPRVVPAGPDNPLGQYALRLGWSGYLLHGSNKPFGVGMQVSHGCLRLLPEDVESLYQRVPIGTTVRVVNQPWLWGERQGHYYLQVFPALAEHSGESTSWQDFLRWLQKKLPSGISVSWPMVQEIFARADGVPTLVAVESGKE
ncbi:MAG: L,D-transpeptidase family protein [Acidithiobacillus sp.]|nr:L,D-transpeptidase family protein [Acidithiobacillus sp.]